MIVKLNVCCFSLSFMFMCLYAQYVPPVSHHLSCLFMGINCFHIHFGFVSFEVTIIAERQCCLDTIGLFYNLSDLNSAVGNNTSLL